MRWAEFVQVDSGLKKPGGSSGQHPKPCHLLMLAAVPTLLSMNYKSEPKEVGMIYLDLTPDRDQKAILVQAVLDIQRSSAGPDAGPVHGYQR